MNFDFEILKFPHIVDDDNASCCHFLQFVLSFITTTAKFDRK